MNLAYVEVEPSSTFVSLEGISNFPRRLGMGWAIWIVADRLFSNRRRKPVRLEARVVLDDELLVDRGLHLVARREAGDGALEGLVVARQPAWNHAGAVLFDGAGGQLAGGIDGLDLNLVTLDDVVGGDVDLVAVHAHVAVIDQLAGGGAALGETEEVDDAVE